MISQEEKEESKKREVLRRVDIRFQSKVEKTSTCWNWVGTRMKGRSGKPAYGVMNVRINGKSFGVLVHRYAKLGEESFEAAEPDRWVLHRCNNKRCVNPDHLYIGTAKDNARDYENTGQNSRSALVIKLYSALRLAGMPHQLLTTVPDETLALVFTEAFSRAISTMLKESRI